VAINTRWIATCLAAAAVFVSVWAGIRIWSTPLRYEVVDATVDGTGANHRSEFVSHGVGVVPLSIPVAISGLGAWAAYRKRRWRLIVAALALAVFSVVTGFSIGAAYLPAVAGLVLASLVAILDRQTPASEARGAA
jgi:hypothetical protein